jgi:hypothetical protein
MTLVERFIEINGWPTSRKTVLLMAVTLPAHLIGWVVLTISDVDNQRVNMAIVHGVVAFGAFVVVLCLACGAFCVRAGKEGRWTGYLVAVLYGGYVFSVIQTAGNWSTPFFAWYPIGVTVLTLWYDERIGWFTFLLGLLHITNIATLQWTGILPYAPALIDRNVDSQQTFSWAGGTMLPILVFFAFCFTLSLLMLASRRLQTVALREANQKWNAPTASSAVTFRRNWPKRLCAVSTPKCSGRNARSSPSFSPISKDSPTPPTGWMQRSWHSCSTNTFLR